MKKKKTDENSINKYKIDINKINADIKNQEKIQPVIHVEPPSYDEISGFPSQTQSLTLLKNQFSPHNLPKQKGEFQIKSNVSHKDLGQPSHMFS